MSLLDRHHPEDIVIYHEETVVDSDGNILTRASATGVPATAVIQVEASSGTSGRRSEQDNEGFESEQNYRLRLPRWSAELMSAQAQIEWRGQRWSIVGEPRRYNNSRRTAHIEYSIRRA